MKFKFNEKEFHKEVMKVAMNKKIEIECPKCHLYCWDYSVNELEELWTIYCNNCDTNINLTINNK